MKTLFGERKSVKTLAFILALALILPLLPVMSVGADAKGTIESVLFKNAYDGTGGQEDWADVYFTSPDGKIDIAAQLESKSSQSKQAWSSNQQVDLSRETADDARDVKLTFNSEMSSNRPKRSLQFAIAPDTSKLSEYVIHLSYKDAEDQPKDVELSPVNGLYTIDVVTHASSDGNYTVQAKAPTPTYTLTFPERRNVSGYTITKGEGATCYGEQTVTQTPESTSFEFTITVNDPTDVPVVRVIWEDDSETSPTKLENKDPKGNEYKYKVDGIKQNGEVVIELHPAVSISYSPAPGTAANSFTISGTGNNGDLYSAPYNTKEFKFTVKAAAGYEITDVKLGSTSIVDDNQESKKDTKDCTIPQTSITKDLTVFVTTEAVTLTVKLDEENTGEGYTVSGIPTDGKNVSYNSSVTFYVTPDPGFDELTVTYTMEGKVVIAAPVPRVGNAYTIDEITGDVTVIINPGKQKTLSATLAGDTDKATIGDAGDKPWESIEYGNDKTFTVKPNPGYKVTAITVRSGNNVLTSNTNSNSIFVSNITTDLRIEVTTEPITITVKINDAGDLTGSYAFKYGESGFNTGWIKWDQTEQGEIFDSEQIDELLKQIGELSGKNATPTRFGFDFDTTKGTKGWIIADESLKVNPNADTTITLTATWKPDYTELFVLKTSVKYDTALQTLSFTSTLAVNDLADDEAKKTYNEVKVTSFGIFYGENSSTLNSDPTTIRIAREIIADASTYKDGNQVTDIFLGSQNSDNRIFYYLSNPTNPVEFLLSGSTNGNTITENFKETENKSRSAITWIKIQLDDGTTEVIVGPATSYNA